MAGHSDKTVIYIPLENLYTTETGGIIKTNPNHHGWGSHLVGVVPGGRTISATDFCVGHSRAGM